MAHWLPALLVISLAGGIEMRAAAPQPPERGAAAPAMVRFYGVDRSGMSTPENPLATGFALDSSASFDPASRSSGTAGQPEAAGQTLHENPAPRSIRMEYTSQRPLDSFRRELDEFQCQRLGFFYSANGRCVIPAWRRITRIPRDHPDPRLRHMSREQALPPVTGPAR
jgi:hypothetical protein